MALNAIAIRMFAAPIVLRLCTSLRYGAPQSASTTMIEPYETVFSGISKRSCRLATTLPMPAKAETNVSLGPTWNGSPGGALRTSIQTNAATTAVMADIKKKVPRHPSHSAATASGVVAINAPHPPIPLAMAAINGKLRGGNQRENTTKLPMKQVAQPKPMIPRPRVSMAGSLAVAKITAPAAANINKTVLTRRGPYWSRSTPHGT